MAGESFDQRPAAEKTILAVLGIGVLIWLYLIFVFEPMDSAREQAANDLMVREARLVTMQQRERTAVIMGNEDPNEARHGKSEPAAAADREPGWESGNATIHDEVVDLDAGESGRPGIDSGRKPDADPDA